MVKRLLIGGLLAVFAAGCSAPPSTISGISKDHPANDFYQYASRMMISDRSCSDHEGNSSVPMGEIAKGERYTKLEELAPGVFRFRDTMTGKQYLGVTYMRREGFLQLPRLCAWEEKK